MLRKLFSLLLVLSIVLSVTPVVPVSAEQIPMTASPAAGNHTATHVCEECTTAWTAWESDNSLPSTGHYYLTKNVTLTKEISITGKLHLCLNGYVITAAAGKRIFNTKGDTATELVITDCTAYTDAAGVYYAGVLTGGQDSSAGGGAIFIRRGGVVKIHDGRLTGNTSTVAGGAVAMQAKNSNYAAGKLYMYGGELSNNTAINGSTYKNGGAIYTGNGSVVELENVILKSNTAISGGVVYTGSLSSALKLKNCVIESNTATGSEAGGVIYASGVSMQLTDCRITDNKAPNGGGAVIWAKTSGTVTMTGCRLEENEAKNAGGAIYIKDKVNLNTTDCTFTGNKSGSGGSVLYYQNYCQISLRDTTITGNIGTSTSASGYSAAVYGVGDASRLTIGGKMIIADNSIKSPNTADVNFGNADTDTLYVDGLADGSRVFFSTKATTDAGAENLVSGTPARWNYNWLTYMDENGRFKMIGYENDQFVFTDGHKHNGCNDAACTEHETVTFKAWTDATALPASGSWYLDTDVTVTKEVRITSGLELCLNGHNVTGADSNIRFFSTGGKGGESLTICDCTAKSEDGVYTAGKLTGNTNNNTGAGGGAIMLRAGATLRLFDGIISDNATVAGGGAIFANSATIEMYGGRISGNRAQNTEGVWKSCGAVYLQSADMTVYGGWVSGNEANDGAGIHMAGSSVLDLRGGKITGNIAHKEGAGVNVATAGSAIKLSGNVQITGNTLTDGSANNLRLSDGKKIELGLLENDAVIGVSAASFQFFTDKTENYAVCFRADNKNQTVIYLDGALYLDVDTDHKHCLCGTASGHGCDHKATAFEPWSDSTKLPSFGRYYLTVDVTVANRTALQECELMLCLNGHTVTVGQQGGRVFRMYSGAHLYLTDCAAEPGKITGATQGAILSDQAGTDMSIDFWNISFTGNHAKSVGGG